MGSSSHTSTPEDPHQPVEKAVPVTPAERYLGKLCQRSFLSLWSYPGPPFLSP
jgi:hypothetical protein